VNSSYYLFFFAINVAVTLPNGNLLRCVFNITHSADFIRELIGRTNNYPGFLSY